MTRSMNRNLVVLSTSGRGCWSLHSDAFRVFLAVVNDVREMRRSEFAGRDSPMQVASAIP